MILLHQEFKQKEIEIMKKCLLEESDLLHDKLISALDMIKIYENNFKNWHLRKNETAQFKDGIIRFQKVEEEYYKEKIKHYGNRSTGAIQKVNFLTF